MPEPFGKTWKDVLGFLKIGATAYGGPAIMGIKRLVRMAPHAAPDPLAVAVLVATLVTLIRWRVAPVTAMLAGSVFGGLRDRVCELPGAGTMLGAGGWGRS